jgi:uridine kinase
VQLYFPDAVEKVLDLICQKQEKGLLHFVLIDGRAGAGKSHFAKELSNSFFKLDNQAARVVSMDDLYPGWEGLAGGSIYLYTNILKPLNQGKTAAWQVWDWSENRRGAKDEVNGHREFSGGTALIVEGCGSISRITSELADLTIWIEAEQATRRTRFNQRDSGKFAGYFSIWSAQEDEFYEKEKSFELAQLVIEN